MNAAEAITLQVMNDTTSASPALRSNSLGAAVGATLGDLLRAWRGKRRLSQLDLALDAGISTRHLSFIETGRATPSRATLHAIAEFYAVPVSILITKGGADV